MPRPSHPFGYAHAGVRKPEKVELMQVQVSKLAIISVSHKREMVAWMVQDPGCILI